MMSFFRSSKLQKLTSKFENLRDRFARRQEGAVGRIKPRRLLIDPLEERQLLSLTPADYTDTLVNQTVNESPQSTIFGQSVASDNDGDFVVAWTRYDPVRDSNGNAVINPATGNPMTDANIYARYFTDEVQRITLPEAVLDDNVSGQYGSFSLIYGGNEVQKISFSATHQPLTFSQQGISGALTLGFDVDGNGFVTGGETATVFYNEFDPVGTTAASIETALQGLGGAMADVDVSPINPKEFLVNFGDLSLGRDQPELTIENVNWTGGFLPAVLTSTEREPIEIGPILVSPDDPLLTATSIEQSFFGTSDDFLIGPINFPPQQPNRFKSVSPDEGPRLVPEVLRTPVAGVTVQPVLLSDGTPSATQFDLVFDGATGSAEGASGKKDQPQLVFSAIADEAGTSLLGSAVLDPRSGLPVPAVRTMKEPSPEFRVNPVEPDNPFTPLPDVVNQMAPTVAMDADGDFVITWQSIIPEWQDRASIADIFARQFSPVGTVDPAEVDFVKSVSAGETFQVNSFTNLAQGQPAVDMDADGNFVIAWASGAQDLSFFNSIKAQRFSRDGTMLGEEFLVNAEDTSFHIEPAVGRSLDGNTVISWSSSDDEDFVLNGGGLVAVDAKAYDADGVVLLNQFNVGGGAGSRIDFDSANNFVITRHGIFDNDRVGGASTGVLAVMRQLFDAQGNVSGAIIRSDFRPNSSEFNTSTSPLWPGQQLNPQPALDADGDLVVLYEGFAPEVSDQAATFADFTGRTRQALTDLFMKPENADLLQYFDPRIEGLPISSFYQDANGNFVSAASNFNVQGEIEQLLLRATNQGASDIQLGRLRALVDQVIGLVRGEADGIMFSSWDASADMSLNRLFSDSIVNAKRDGVNKRYIFALDRINTTGASINFSLFHPLSAGVQRPVAFAPVYVNNVLNVSQTRAVLERILQAADETGDTFDAPGPRTAGEGGPQAVSDGVGTVEVRIMQFGTGSLSSEIAARQGTPWDLTGGSFFGSVNANEAVYEITFTGEAHDIDFVMNFTNPTTTQPQGAPPPKLFQYNQADSGITQTGASIAMEPDGDFVAVWTQLEEHTSDAFGYPSVFGSGNQNIFYRRFDEDTDTAGPTLTDLVNSSGDRVADGQDIAGEVRHIVLPFDEPLMAGDPSVNPDSVLNPNNYAIFRGGVEIPFGVAKAEYGMNKAADLAGQSDGLGGTYDLNSVPTNKYEVVLTLDANGGITPGTPALRTGAYTIRARTPRPADGVSGLRDVAGNPLGFTGHTPGGKDFDRNFVVRLFDPDVTVQNPSNSAANLINGTLDPENPGAVAVDADGDHVIVWTAYDTTVGHDRMFMRMFAADGSPADLVGVRQVGGAWVPATDVNGNLIVFTDAAPVLPVTPSLPAKFDHLAQRNGNVAIDDDGDFVVTWTGYDAGGNADIYARRFDSRGEILGIDVDTGNRVFKGDATEAFRVNGYTDNQQKWPDVAMDREGDFVITWSSYGQEDNGQLGTGYGVYARRYDWTGVPLAPEFPVNVTTAGNQHSASVAMGAPGNFVVAWTSDQNGIGDDIVAREFNADGSPEVGPLGGEIVVNDITPGDQRFPDVAMRLDGETYIVTWTDSAADISGSSVWAELSRPLPKSFIFPNGVSINATHNLTLNITDSFIISDLNIQLGIIQHLRLEDLEVHLISPAGTDVLLFQNLPRPFVDGTRPAGGSMVTTLFDDEAPTSVRITDSDAGAVPPYNGAFVPQQILQAFDGENVQGTWTLRIIDTQPQNNLTGTLTPVLPEIGGWRLIVDELNGVADSFLVNSSRAGQQFYSSVGMDYQGNFTVSWSGRGDQRFQEDPSGFGVFYQRYDQFGTRQGLETRANINTDGDQWISSIDSDAEGNFVLAWTGVGPTPGTTDVFRFVSVNDAPRIDSVGPIVSDLLIGGIRVADGDFADPAAGGVSQLTVVFNEALSIDGGLDGLHSVLNTDHWILQRNGSEIVGGVSQVDFRLNPLNNKYEALLTLDGNGLSSGTPPLPEGDYLLSIRDQITDVSIFFDPQGDPDQGITFGNALDGDIDGVPASSPITLGFGGYQHQFYVVSSPAIGAEFRINPEGTKQYEQRFVEAGGIGFAREESTRSVAVDHDGDFVTVWTSYGQDDPDDTSGGGVYLRMFDRDNNPLTGETLVNGSAAFNAEPYTAGHQRNASVGIDADGEFVVVWESEGQDADGSWGIYGKRYSSVGTPQIYPLWEMVQRLTFDQTVPGSLSGDFRLKIGDDVTDPIALDGSDPNGVAAAIQTALGNLKNGSQLPIFPDVVVRLASGTDPLEFEITFGGSGTGSVQPIIEYLPNASAPLGANVQVEDVSADPFIFRVNIEVTGDQTNPAVAIDDFGNFVVVWATSGQGFSFFNNIRGQRYNNLGEPQGLELLINSNDLPGTNPPGNGSFEVNPAVAMSGPSGTFVVAWDLVTQQQNGVVLDSVVAARMFQPDGSPVAGEFQANTGPGSGGTDIDRVARNPQLVVDDAGGFIVVWESFSGNPIDGYSVFYRQFDNSGQAGATAQANMPQFADHQVNPSVGIDADGDFSIVWNGAGGQPDPIFPNNQSLWADQDQRGVFIRQYHASAAGVAPAPVTVQSRVNRTEVGFQEFPSIGVEPDGDRIVVWSGRGIGDRHGIFARRFDEPTDTAGPRATELRLTDGTLVNAGGTISGPQRLVVVFDENLWTDGPDSVENIDNWILRRDFVDLEGRIVDVQFGLNESSILGLPGATQTNKWEAVLTFDRDPDIAGLTPLPAGEFTLIVRHPIAEVPETAVLEGQSGIRDAVGNPLNRTAFNPSGLDTSFTFSVSSTGSEDQDDPIDPNPNPDGGVVSVTNGRTFPENRQAIGMDFDGDHVVALTVTDDATGLDKVVVRLFDAEGVSATTRPGLFFVTTEPEFNADQQRNAAVATDADGDFIITWTNFRNGDEDIYARRFFADGSPMGPSFRVNTFTDNTQTWSSVAMDPDGDVVVTWSSYAQEFSGQLGSGWGVYARRYDSFGQPLAPEFPVNVTTGGNQHFSSVAMSSDGGFVIAWTSDQNGIGDDVVVRLFNADGSALVSPLGGEVMVNDTTEGNQRFPDVAITPSGDNFLVTWTSTGQDGSGDGIFGQMIDVPLLIQGNQQAINTYTSADPFPIAFGFGNSVLSTVTVPDVFPDNFTIADADVLINIRHAVTRQVEATLISPAGTAIKVFANVPRNAAPSSDFLNTRFNDEGVDAQGNPLRIVDPTPGVVVAPFTNPSGYVPQEPLSAFDGQLSSGTWQLFVQDTSLLVDGTLEGWTLELTRVPARSGEFQINQSTAGNQSFSSIAMDRQGAFTVAWSGSGDQENQQDTSGSGVFYRRYEFSLTPLSDEVRANVITEGEQRFASIAGDAHGNFGLVWTGQGTEAGTTNVFRLLSTKRISVPDFDGPVVSEILAGNDRLIDGDVVGTDVSSLTVRFSEKLSELDGDVGLGSVTNPSNWIVERNGSEIPDAITGITFGLNPDTRKYEAVVSFDGNGLNSGNVPLLPGDYVLTVRDEVKDAIGDNSSLTGNSLDGDFDGSPGTVASGTGFPGFKFEFSVADGPQLGPEMRLNDAPRLVQRISAPLGTGFARENNTRAVAIDHDGDFAAVWTSYGQDSDGSSGVYLRLYDRNNQPGIEIPVTSTPGNQYNPAVAIDADGDLVVVWESQSQDPDGSSGIFARRFNSIGQPLGGEFQVHSNTADDQFRPAVGMDDDGNFTIVWGTESQQFSFSNDIRGQRYNYRGERLGSEFLVNDVNIPGGIFEVNPAMAMDDDGNFAVAWEQIITQANGVITDSQVMAKMFDANGVPLGPEFPADTGVGSGGGDVFRTARNPQLTMDDSGGLIVVWESFGSDDTGPTSYGVYYQKFDATGAAVASGLVNMPEFAGEQVNPSVGVDADGDFVVVWNGAGGTADPLNPTDPTLFSDLDNEGVFKRHFDTTNAIISVQTRVNTTDGGIQNFPTIAMEPDGDHLVVWSGAGVADRHGIFARRYDEPSDSVGPKVSDLAAPSGERIGDGTQVSESLPLIIVSFDEEMMTSGPNSVTNPANYSLSQDGSPVVGLIREVHFGLNEAFNRGLSAFPTNKWEAVLVLDGNGSAAGQPPLEQGNYELLVRSAVRDKAGNPLESTRSAPNGASFSRRFNLISAGGGESRVNTGSGEAFVQSGQSVTSDADSDYVTVWVNTTPGEQGVWARIVDTQRSEADGKQLSAVASTRVFQVTGEGTAQQAAVASDADGDFVVTWSQNNPLTGWDVYAHRYDATGESLGDTFLVNSETENTQDSPAVAMDENGDFVITWQSFDQDGDGWGIYAQRYNPAGVPLGGRHEVQVINFTGNPRGTFKLRWDGDPSTPNTTGNIAFDGSTFGIEETIRQELAAIGAEVQVVAISLSEISIRFVGTGGTADQLPISVASQSVSGDPGAGVAMTTALQGSSGEFLVNDTTADNQMHPSIAMDASGSIAITWTGFGQDGDAVNESNIYGKRLPANEAIRGTTLRPTAEQLVGINPVLQGAVQPRYLGPQTPDSYLIPDGSGFDGVSRVIAGGAIGSGVLLKTGIHVLTAAHVVEDPASLFGAPLPAASITIQFLTPDGVLLIPAVDVQSNPRYTGNIALGGDLAVVTLAFAPPTSVERFDIYRKLDEIGKVGTKFGLGNTGDGNQGEIAALFDGLRRGGQNRYDASGSIMGMPDDLLFYDFDNGLAQNDAFGVSFGINDLGLGVNEINSATGDSGGPTFIDGKIAGIVSGGVTNPFDPTDLDGATNASYGEFSFDARVAIHAEWIDAVTQFGPEFLVNQTTTADQKWSSVAMDAEGDFVVTWTGYGQDGVGNGYGVGVGGQNGVFARRFSGAGALSDEFQVNTFAQGDQQLSRVSMDADGDFAVAWQSQAQDGDGWGIYAKRYASSERGTGQPVLDPVTGLPLLDPFTGRPLLSGLSFNDPFLGPNGEIGGELAINSTTQGDQQSAGVAMDDTGNFVVVWSGQGAADPQGVFRQRFEQSTDNAGARVTDVFNVLSDGPQAKLGQLVPEPVLDENVSQFVLTFSEDLSIEGGENGLQSVLNPFNWELRKDGNSLTGGIASIEFGLNQASLSGLAPALGKFEALVTFDGDSAAAGREPLGAGSYQLIAKEAIEDLFKNLLDGNSDGTPGGDFVFPFHVFSGLTAPGGPGGIGDPSPEDSDSRVNAVLSGNQQSPAVASNADGDHVVVWTTQSPIDPNVPLAPVATKIVARLYDRFGQPKSFEFTVASFQSGSQIEPDVAMDRFGNFVVSWSGQGEDDTVGVFSRVFDAVGNPVGDQFRVNQSTDDDQDAPSVAMDANGDFIVSWSSYGQDGPYDSIFARRFNNRGQAVSAEFIVNTHRNNHKESSDVAADPNGNFVVVWAAMGQDESGLGVFGQRFDSAGNALGGEFRINGYGHDTQYEPQVAMDRDGNFVVSWSSNLQDGSGWGVYARRFSSSGASLGGEFLVNQTTLLAQHQPAVSSDDDGNFTISWTSLTEEDDNTDGNNIFARMFNADGTDYVNPATGQAIGEFRVNADTDGDQTNSAVAMDADGDFVVVWVGPDLKEGTDPNNPNTAPLIQGTGIFSRIVAINPQSYQSDSDTGAGLGGYTGRFLSASPAGTGELALRGTAGDDTFEVTPAVGTSPWMVKINGVEQPLNETIVGIRFDGLGGTDTVLITGSGADETVQLSPHEVTATSGAFTFSATNIEQVTVNGGGGSDTITIDDSAGDDSLVGRVGRITITDGSTYSHQANGFSTMVANSSGGEDVAQLYDSDGSDTFISKEEFSTLEGPGYFDRVNGYKYIHAYATGGGEDQAQLYDTAGNDRFKGYPTYARLFKGSYVHRAKFFENVVVFATAGGNDDARFFDSPQDDLFEAGNGSARFSNAAAGFDITIQSFDTVLAFSRNGGTDNAVFQGSAARDIFVAKAHKSIFSGDGSEYTVRDFETVRAISSTPNVGGATDVAKLYDTPGDDHFVADGQSAAIYNSDLDMIYEAIAFDIVKARRFNGGNDTRDVSAGFAFDLEFQNWPE